MNRGLLSRRSSQHWGSSCRPLCWSSKTHSVGVGPRQPQHPPTVVESLTGSKTAAEPRQVVESPGRKGCECAAGHHCRHCLMVSQDCEFGDCLACRTSVGFSRCTGRCDGSSVARLPSEVIDYAGADCCDGEKFFLCSHDPKDQESPRPAYAASQQALQVPNEHAERCYLL